MMDGWTVTSDKYVGGDLVIRDTTAMAVVVTMNEANVWLKSWI